LRRVITVLSLQAQLAPPTANYREPDAECSLDLVTGGPRSTNMRFAMSNSLGFWGKNAALIFERSQPS
jgi:3-oxoacyl-(acyl-carrier-protein) synthase